ncbi:ATP-grasp domain-containing protein [Vagococcus sp. WN89Y]|uniref:ATP-grasp domain-containing protein n=1 Tax=Vagococcus sp. WN89Y TaxID=3457258 RepID=UPI003FCE7509
MNNKIWLMESFSSQKDLILGINAFANFHKKSVAIYASHRNERNEILSIADYSLIEPVDADARLSFIQNTVARHGINVIHAGRNTLWFEAHRAIIETFGVSLVTGATSADWLTLADDKASFAQFMQQQGLPVVSSWRINSADELQAYVAHPPFSDSPLCVKPIKGIYGMGFWRFDGSASLMEVFTHPEKRIVHPKQYLAAAASAEAFTPLVLMPWLPGPEYSVDILADKGEVLAAIGRRKEEGVQYLENAGEAFDLACACAKAMNADGLVNVQTRNDSSGKPVLLEINMRPSGGIGYTRHSGVNLAGLFAFYQLGMLSRREVIDSAAAAFSPAVVRPVTDVIAYPATLTNRLN